MPNYTIRRGDKVAGPLSVEQIRELVQQGQLQVGDFATPEGTNAWTTVGSLLGSAQGSDLDQTLASSRPVDNLDQTLASPPAGASLDQTLASPRVAPVHAPPPPKFEPDLSATLASAPRPVVSNPDLEGTKAAGPAPASVEATVASPKPRPAPVAVDATAPAVKAPPAAAVDRTAPAAKPQPAPVMDVTSPARTPMPPSRPASPVSRATVEATQASPVEVSADFAASSPGGATQAPANRPAAGRADSGRTQQVTQSMPHGSASAPRGTSGGGIGTPAAPGKDLAKGDVLDGRYLILKKLGSGGMCTVYRAMDRETEVEYGVKVIRPERLADPAVIKELSDEVSLAQRFSHPNLLRVNHLEVRGSLGYVLMELVDGGDLEQLRVERGGSLPPDLFLKVATNVLQGLHYLHDKGLVHLDIKPQNILVGKDGTAKIADFGISRSIHEQLAATDESKRGAGSAPYMAPEQIRGDVCDRRADIYAIGVMFHRLLTGEFPFKARTREEVFQWAQGPEADSSNFPADYRAILAKCMRRKASERYQNCMQLLAAMDPAAAGVEINEQTMLDLLESGRLDESETVARQMLRKDASHAGAWAVRAAVAAGRLSTSYDAAPVAELLRTARRSDAQNPLVKKLEAQCVQGLLASMKSASQHVAQNATASLAEMLPEERLLFSSVSALLALEPSREPQALEALKPVVAAMEALDVTYDPSTVKQLLGADAFDHCFSVADGEARLRA